MESERDDQEKTHQKHAQLMSKLPKANGWWQQYVYLYQGNWLYADGVLGAMLMQNHFKHRSTDIFLSAFMKSGTTWMRALMFTVLNRSSISFDFSDHPLLRQGPHGCFPGFDLYISQDYPITDMDVLPSPRLFATHYAHNLFPSSATNPSSGCKFVYVCRDPKDVFVSKFHFMKNLRSKELPPLSFDQAFEMFCEGVSEYGPYWDHVLGFWRASRESPDKILFLKYEELKIEPEIHVKRLAEFMGVPISFEEEEIGVIDKIVNFCSFKNLKNLEVNKTGIQRFKAGVETENKLFFRRGEVGDWKNHFTEEMRDRIEQITQDKFKGSGLTLGATPK